MTNLLSVWTPHAASLSRAFCMFYYLFKQNTQPAKMAKAMNSFGFSLSLSRSRLLPRFIALSVGLLSVLNMDLMDFWGP